MGEVWKAYCTSPIPKQSGISQALGRAGSRVALGTLGPDAIQDHPRDPYCWTKLALPLSPQYQDSKNNCPVGPVTREAWCIWQTRTHHNFPKTSLPGKGSLPKEKQMLLLRDGRGTDRWKLQGDNSLLIEGKASRWDLHRTRIEKQSSHEYVDVAHNIFGEQSSSTYESYVLLENA